MHYPAISPVHTWVGVIWSMSSEASCFKIVVLPALSRPSNKILNSCSGPAFNFFNSANKPWECFGIVRVFVEIFKKIIIYSCLKVRIGLNVSVRTFYGRLNVHGML